MLLRVQVRSLSAHGGGDEPEDVLAALQKASVLAWRAKARFLVLITDPPAHGADCNNGAGDKYPAGSPTPGCSVPKVMRALRTQSIDPW